MARLNFFCAASAVLFGALSASIGQSLSPSPSPQFPDTTSAAYRAGQADAARDLKRNILAVESWGLPADISLVEPYQKFLRRKYGIRLRLVGLCEVGDATANHAEGYNKVSQAEITRRYGADILDRAYAEVEKRAAAKTK